jgi:hypothetical protein
MQEQKLTAIIKRPAILKILIHKFTQIFTRKFSKKRRPKANKKPRRGGVFEVRKSISL